MRSIRVLLPFFLLLCTASIPWAQEVTGRLDPAWMEQAIEAQRQFMEQQFQAMEALQPAFPAAPVAYDMPEIPAMPEMPSYEMPSFEMPELPATPELRKRPKTFR